MSAPAIRHECDECIGADSCAARCARKETRTNLETLRAAASLNPPAEPDSSAMRVLRVLAGLD